MICSSSRPLLLLAIALVAAPHVDGRAEAPATGQPPNVVLIVSDDQHWGDFGFMGHPHLQTPNLDRLAAESLVYRRGYVPSSLCCPSLASLITGRYPHEHGITGNDPPERPGVARSSPEGRRVFAAGRERLAGLLDAWPTLPRLLAARGYRSLQTGKWWQGDFTRGGFTEGMTRGERHGDDGLKIGRESMEPIADFVGRCRRADTPFLVWYAPLLPHDPHDPPQDLIDRYASLTDSIHVARYWANVERFDRTVGELLELLDREKVAEDTLVVFVTDNGWIQSDQNPRYAPCSKRSPYDGGLRTPIMLRWPGRITPGSSDSLASSLDIMPTVLAACEAEQPANLPGLNLLDNAAVSARTQLFGECYTHTIVDLDQPTSGLLWRWTVRGHWKLIEPAPAAAELLAGEGRIATPESLARFKRGEPELYDLEADPREAHNLAATRPKRVRELAESLDAWWSPPAARDAPEPAAAARLSSSHRPPNLLVFLADDLGAHDLGCTGSSFYRTPAIDRLASEGMLFPRGYAACPVCSPTRAALVTGRHPARVGITNFIGGLRKGHLLPAPFRTELPLEDLTVAEQLQQAGYATGVFGKWHLGDARAIPDHGFGSAELTTVAPGSGPPDDPMHARAIAAAAAGFIRDHGGQPWFCYVPMHSVHVPLITRPELAAEEGRRAIGVSPRFDRPPQSAGDPITRGVQDHPVYAGMIREMDETVATVLAAVDEFGQRDTTLVVFTSDNGGLATAEGSPTSNLPLRAGKGFVYEGGIRVPLVIRWPGVAEPGSRCDQPVTTLDLAATLLGAAGATPPADVVLDGLDLKPLLAATGSLPERDLYWHYPHYSNQGGRPAGAVIVGAEKLVEHFEDGRLELFDLATDPGERNDLSGTHPDRAAELQLKLAAWRERVGAGMPRPNPEPVAAFPNRGR
jgi:arylsulfatase A-like enzyme